MDDLEICKRIAEIEGFEYYKLTDQGYMAFNEGINNSITDRVFFNPLTDDALCFQLMVKYKVTFESCLFYKNMFSAFAYAEHEVKVLPKAHESSPNRAICLAIIEANK